MDKNKKLASALIHEVVKWKWGATCYVKYNNDATVWEIFEWSSDDIAQPTNAEIEAEIPNYQAVLDAKAIEEETAKQVKADLKASAKAKLVAGEALTEDEANTIVL
nr:hypothetical protein [uncultured Mediterranean phage uvMED]BAR27289.1 hypothetical protein [uncultured Mediterranean phage uvMED]